MYRLRKLKEGRKRETSSRVYQLYVGELVQLDAHTESELETPKACMQASTTFLNPTLRARILNTSTATWSDLSTRSAGNTIIVITQAVRRCRRRWNKFSAQKNCKMQQVFFSALLLVIHILCTFYGVVSAESRIIGNTTCEMNAIAHKVHRVALMWTFCVFFLNANVAPLSSCSSINAAQNVKKSSRI